MQAFRIFFLLVRKAKKKTGQICFFENYLKGRQRKKKKKAEKRSIILLD